MKKLLPLVALMLATPAVAQTSLIDLVTEVHNSVNHEIKYKTDRKAGKSYYDSWDLPSDGYGDCEDISLLKKIRLIQAGVDPNDVKLLIVKRPVDGVRDKNVVVLHVVNYIPSLNLILDNSGVVASGANIRRKKVPIMSYEDWMSSNKATLLCEVVDESLGDNISLDKRCGKSVIAMFG